MPRFVDGPVVNRLARLAITLCNAHTVYWTLAKLQAVGHYSSLAGIPAPLVAPVCCFTLPLGDLRVA
jgi:hypothetical protein